MAEYVAAPDAPVVALSAGLHGDEPAAPWALLSLARDGLLDRRFSYRIWPCLNPTGTVAGTRVDAEGNDPNRGFGGGGRTPEARALLTANRDRVFELALDLHEDVEATGFYLYEPLGAGARSVYADEIVGAIRDAGLPVQDLVDGYDLGAPPGVADCYTLSPGVVLVDAPREMVAFGRDLPLTLALLRRGTRATLTFESPVLRPWEERIASHRVAVTTAIARLAQGRTS